jgi:antitoxin ParD1/3/4
VRSAYFAELIGSATLPVLLPEGTTMNVSIGAHWEQFLEKVLSEGRYGSVSEIVQEGLRLVEEREAKLKALRDEINAAIDGGGDNSADDIDAMIDGLVAASRAKAG